MVSRLQDGSVGWTAVVWVSLVINECSCTRLLCVHLSLSVTRLAYYFRPLQVAVHIRTDRISSMSQRPRSNPLGALLNPLHECSKYLLLLHDRLRRALKQRIKLVHRQILVIFPMEAGHYDFSDQAAYPVLLRVCLSCLEIFRKNARLLPNAGAYEKHARLPGCSVIAHDFCLDTRWVCRVDESVFGSALMEDVVGLSQAIQIRREISILYCASCCVLRGSNGAGAGVGVLTTDLFICQTPLG